MLFAIILAGGRGERFWPKSTRRNPKQFIPIIGETSMISTTCKRIFPMLKEDNIFIVAPKDLQDSILKTLPWMRGKNILKEPMGKNTALAIGYAAVSIERYDKDGIMIVLPADHFIPDEKKFLNTLKVAIDVAKKGYLVTFGIVPLRPETGYGYIEVNAEVIETGKTLVYRSNAFKEKPNLRLAQRFVKSGKYLWNSGMFVWKISTIMDAFAQYMPELYERLEKFRRSPTPEVLNRIYKALPHISIDYGIMERAKNVAVVRADFMWDDVGSWLALERMKKKDKNGNIIDGGFIGTDTKDSIILSDSGLIATIGVDNLIIVRTKNTTLVCKKSMAQEVRKIVSLLGTNGLEKYL